MNNIQTFITKDGSIGLYDLELDEIYHSKFGALTEAMEKFVEPASIIDNHPLDILDICYGIGYNTKCAIKTYQNIKSIDCLEINPELIEKSFEFEPKIDFKNKDFITFYIEDARHSILKLNKTYDIIFHDGFAPHKQAVLWSEDFILKVSSLLKKDGIYCTYNHSKPVLNALFKTGLTVGKTLKEEKTIATVASFNKNLIKNPLNNFELAQLNTKSAITYKDKNLNLTHGEIIKNREIEVKNSKLESLSHFKKQTLQLKNLNTEL